MIVCYSTDSPILSAPRHHRPGDCQFFRDSRDYVAGCPVVRHNPVVTIRPILLDLSHCDFAAFYARRQAGHEIRPDDSRSEGRVADSPNSSRSRRSTRDFATRTAPGLIPSSIATSFGTRSSTAVSQNARHVRSSNSPRISSSARPTTPRSARRSLESSRSGN